MGKQQLITVCMILLLIFKSYFSLKSSTICLKIPLNYQKNNSPKPLQVIICPFLRIWFGSWIKNDFIEPGMYLIVNADKPDTKENLKRVQDLGKYKGIAAIKYVEETRSPRMEYHTGLSLNNDETIEVTKGTDGYLTATFSNTTLDGFFWKEKATATVFGGFGRLVNKMEDKAVTKATGYDSDIDPEYNGYKKQDKKDKIMLKDGRFRLKIE
ncbi:MAG: hypothetical protein U5N85_20280 [Arcicella sp.]|nr:hypothetical protein [Arcicella sp.]